MRSSSQKWLRANSAKSATESSSKRCSPIASTATNRNSSLFSKRSTALLPMSLVLDTQSGVPGCLCLQWVLLSTLGRPAQHNAHLLLSGGADADLLQVFHLRLTPQSQHSLPARFRCLSRRMSPVSSDSRFFVRPLLVPCPAMASLHDLLTVRSTESWTMLI